MLLKRTLSPYTLAVSLRIALLITHHILSADDHHIFIMFYKLLPDKMPFDITTRSAHDWILRLCTKVTNLKLNEVNEFYALSFLTFIYWK
jgi:hypothetical protein